ncbi:hypothetical protein ACLOJK_015985 [Asimina triloba]
MYPPPASFQGFRKFEEFQKTVVQQQQQCLCCMDHIPPPPPPSHNYNYNMSMFHSSLHFHNQMKITNRTIRSQHHPSNTPMNSRSSRVWSAKPKLENVYANPTRTQTQQQQQQQLGDTSSSSSSLMRQQMRLHCPHYSSAAAAFAETEKKHMNDIIIQYHDVNLMSGVILGGGGGGNGAGAGAELVEENLFNLMDACFDGSSESEETRRSFQHQHHKQQPAPDQSSTTDLDTLSPAAKRHRRMIKNRESAARSRARKLAYTTQLEIEVAQLRKENELLKKGKKLPNEPAVADQQEAAGPSHRHSKMLGDQPTADIDGDSDDDLK